MLKLKIRKGDQVQVLTGSDKGKKGEVIAISATLMKVKVAGVRITTHFDKKDGMKKLEGYIDYSNVKLVEKAAATAKAKKPTAKKKTASKNA